LAGFAFHVTEGLDQLGIAAIAGLCDLDEQGTDCSSDLKGENYLKSETCHYKNFLFRTQKVT
jgi:hypothetical protein